MKDVYDVEYHNRYHPATLKSWLVLGRFILVCHVVLSTSYVSLFLLFFSHSCVFLSVFFPSLFVGSSVLFLGTIFLLRLPAFVVLLFWCLLCLLFVLSLFFCSWIAPVLSPDFLPARCLNFSNFGVGLALWFCIGSSPFS